MAKEEKYTDEESLDDNSIYDEEGREELEDLIENEKSEDEIFSTLLDENKGNGQITFVFIFEFIYGVDSNSCKAPCILHI